jgi:hypothetical protein
VPLLPLVTSPLEVHRYWAPFVVIAVPIFQHIGVRLLCGMQDLGPEVSPQHVPNRPDEVIRTPNETRQPEISCAAAFAGFNYRCSSTDLVSTEATAPAV